MKDGKVDRFKVDENGLTVDGYRCLEPESKRSMYLGNAITMVISAAIVLLIVMYGGSWLGDYYDIACIGLYVLLAVIVVGTLVIAAFSGWVGGKMLKKQFEKAGITA